MTQVLEQSKKLNEIHRMMREIKSFMELSDWVSKKEAAEILEVSPRTLDNMVYDGTIAPELYTTCVNRVTRKYSRTGLMGLKK